MKKPISTPLVFWKKLGKTLVSWTYQKKLGVLVVFGVTLAHLFLVFLPKPSLSPARVKPLLIRTYDAQPKAQVEAQVEKPLPVTPQQATLSQKKPKKKSNPTKKSPAKRPSKKKVKKPQANQPARQKLREILDQITPIQSTIEGHTDLDIPSQLTGLHAQRTKGSQDNHRDSELIAYLKKCLELPEYGQVTVEITIAQGEINHMRILAASSKANADYLRSRLTQLTFPITGAKSLTRVITFCNEE